MIYRQVADRQDGLTNSRTGVWRLAQTGGSGREMWMAYRLAGGWETDAAARTQAAGRQTGGWQTGRRLADRQTAGIQTGGK